MKVRELIEKLKEEDPDAKAVVINAVYKKQTLRQIRSWGGGYMNELIVAGKDSSQSGVPCVVLIGEDIE